MKHRRKALLVILDRLRKVKPRSSLLAFFLSVFCSPVSLGAQQAPNQLYEGLTVSSVDLVAQPTINAEDFRPLVAQKVETPYSAAEIQKTIAALEGTRKFTKVEVEVRPEADGLRVMFIMEPVYYIGVIDFPGATKEFSYPRLLQTVNYPDQEPYEAARAEEGRTRLTQFFVQQGYFTAQVRVETKLDRARELADIDYNVTLGRRAKFGNIEITGAPPTDAARLKNALRSFRARLHGANVKEGKPYSPERLQAATKWLRDFLGRQNHLANHVEMGPSTYDPQTNRVTLNWQVTEGSTVKVSVAGARISKRSVEDPDSHIRGEHIRSGLGSGGATQSRFVLSGQGLL